MKNKKKALEINSLNTEKVKKLEDDVSFLRIKQVMTTITLLLILTTIGINYCSLHTIREIDELQFSHDNTLIQNDKMLANFSFTHLTELYGRVEALETGRDTVSQLPYWKNVSIINAITLTPLNMTSRYNESNLLLNWTYAQEYSGDLFYCFYYERWGRIACFPHTWEIRQSMEADGITKFDVINKSNEGKV